MSAREEPAPGAIGFYDVLSKIDRLPKATIAVVQGGCVGGGLGIAACCDVLLAQESAFFSVPELRVGIAPSSQLANILIRAMGPRAFRRYGLSGERIPAAEARRIGLAHEVLGAEDLDRHIAELADAFLHNAPAAFAEFKDRIFGQAPGDAAAPSGGAKGGGLARSPEAIEGIAAFREKRKPSWYPAGYR
jgi:methylglutaconyl-CoA hydratase